MQYCISDKRSSRVFLPGECFLHPNAYVNDSLRHAIQDVHLQHIYYSGVADMLNHLISILHANRIMHTRYCM